MVHRVHRLLLISVLEDKYDIRDDSQPKTEFLLSFAGFIAPPSGDPPLEFGVDIKKVKARRHLAFTDHEKIKGYGYV